MFCQSPPRPSHPGLLELPWLTGILLPLLSLKNTQPGRSHPDHSPSFPPEMFDWRGWVQWVSFPVPGRVAAKAQAVAGAWTGLGRGGEGSGA